MTQAQKDEIDETIAYVRGARDVLELHERRIRDFGNLMADPGDPYSIDAVDVDLSITESITDNPQNEKER